MELYNTLSFLFDTTLKKIMWSMFFITIFLYSIWLIVSPYITSNIVFPSQNIEQIHALGWKKIILSTQNNTVVWYYIDIGASQTIYYFHGKSFHKDNIDHLIWLGYNILLLAYPWEAGATGNMQYIQKDAEILFQYVQQTYNIPKKSITVWGQDVWAGPALTFSKNHALHTIVLDTPMTSTYVIVENKIWYPFQKIFGVENQFILETLLSDTQPPIFIITDTSLSSSLENIYQVARDADTSKKLEYFLEYRRYDVDEYEEKIFLMWLDMKSDTSVTKYVDPQFSYENIAYIPEDMRRLQREVVIDTKGNAQLREVAARAFEDMAQQFYEDMGEKMVVVSSYRSYAYQAGIKARGCPDSLCAKAGYSEHQSWLTIDLWSASSDAYWKNSPRLQAYTTWLKENAHHYWFHNTYQKGKDIDGYEIEPWHWRYLTKDFATYLWENDMTFAEYYYTVFSRQDT